MTHNQLNEYIEHYLDKDKIQSAIMLTGAWGSGKSYYIKHNLIPYLKEKNKDCVVVSLYGISDLNDISKVIYMELRSIKLFKSNEATETAKIVGKTVLKNVAQFVPLLNINAEIDKKDLQNLYESVDLTGKLIIFEDIERSQINIIKFLGYVNNFVEQDKVKVLLVVNEQEILNKHLPIDLRSNYEKQEDLFLQVFENDSLTKKEEIDKKLMPENIKEYILVKEKSVSDTIKFTCDYQEAIINIIGLFENKLNKFLESDDINEISNIVKSNTGNLRSFLFACQKTSDILDHCTSKNKEVLKCIFFSIIYFSLNYKKNSSRNWEESDEISFALGSKKYPLFKCCYEYIVNHNLDQQKIDNIDSYYRKFKQYNSDEYSNTDINTLYNYTIKSESELASAIDNIEKSLETDEILYNTYGKLAKYLVEVSKILEKDIAKAKALLINNLRTQSGKIDEYLLFIDDRVDNEDSMDAEYVNLKKQMLSNINAIRESGWEKFTYCPEDIKSFYVDVVKNSRKEILRDTLSAHLNLKKFVQMLSECTSEQIKNVRAIFCTIYGYNGKIIYAEKDNKYLEQLHSKVEKLSNKKDLDKIIKLQLNHFMSNLKDIMDKKECES